MQFIEEDEKWIVKYGLIIIGLLAIPVGLSFLLDFIGITAHPLQGRIVGATMLLVGTGTFAMMIWHIKKTLDEIIILGEVAGVAFLYILAGLLLIFGQIDWF